MLARADPDDRDGDGISGRANRVWNPDTGRIELGRFGWKANAATVLAQSAGAAHGDMGLSNRVFPGENCAAPGWRSDASIRPGSTVRSAGSVGTTGR